MKEATMKGWVSRQQAKALKAVTAVFVMVLMSTAAEAVIVNYDNLTDYNTAVGAHEIITFTEFAVGTTVTTQYSPQGVIFGDGNDFIITNGAFTVDGVGLDAAGSIELLFSSQQTAIGSEFPGALQFAIYNGATFLGSSDQFGGSGSGFFGGLVSSDSFDRVIITDWVDGSAYIDNLHFGSASVPEPGTLLLLGSGLVGMAGFRRRFKA